MNWVARVSGRGVTVVAGVLVNHVVEGPPERNGLAAAHPVLAEASSRGSSPLDRSHSASRARRLGPPPSQLVISEKSAYCDESRQFFKPALPRQTLNETLVVNLRFPG